MNRYRYTRLNAARAEIRLIHLLPGTFSDDIEIEIFHVKPNFPKEGESRKEGSTDRKPGYRFLQAAESHGTPSYEALSYVWGSEANPSFVCVREVGRPSSSQLPVTQNLAEAMRYFRKEDESRVLWIDAVCINQQDLAERSVQVRRMGDIFRHAKQVGVWLGPESASSDIAVDLVHIMARDLVTDRKSRAKHTVLPDSDTAKLLASKEDLLPRLKALEKLCQRQ